MGKKGGSQLGRQLAKSHQTTKRTTKTSNQSANTEGYLHSADLQDGYDWGRLNLQSVTEEASYNEFLNTAELARKDFDAEKWNVKLLDAQTRQVYIDTSEKKVAAEDLTDDQKILRIPRRPDWTHLTAEELRVTENDSFLEWRRGLSVLQENTDCVITPYEKNLEFWRQLWRVIERSDVVIQIVDARNPELFRCKDLEDYVKEVSPLKQNMILINKADYLSEDQRKAWAAYLSGEHMNNTKFAFFSAIEEDDVEDSEEGEPANNPSSEDEDEDEDCTETQSSESKNETDQSTETEPSTETDQSTDNGQSTENAPESFDDPCEVFTADRLMDYFRSLKRTGAEILTFGFIGYPNVGKSSTINKILKSKKVRVSETPGKTKHFQTHVLSSDLILCDCPGLVMPNFVVSKAHMVLNGILPIDQLRDHVPSVNLMLQNIPTHVLEATYGLVLPKEPDILSSEQVLTAYGTLRGFMTAGGCPDQARAARILLKDYVSGRLLHCQAPAGVDQKRFHSHVHVLPRRVFKDEEHQHEAAMRLQQMRHTKTEEVDSRFFAKMSVGSHVRGNKPLTGRLSDKNKKKEKARRIYKDLDPKHA